MRIIRLPPVDLRVDDDLTIPASKIGIVAEYEELRRNEQTNYVEFSVVVFVYGIQEYDGLVGLGREYHIPLAGTFSSVQEEEESIKEVLLEEGCGIIEGALEDAAIRYYEWIRSKTNTEILLKGL